MRTLKRQIRDQQKELQRLQEMMLENQRLLLGGGMCSGAAPSLMMMPAPPRAAAAAAAAGGVVAPYPLACAPAPRGEMPYEARQTLHKSMEKLGAPALTRALKLAKVSLPEDGVLDLETLDSAQLWRLHDFCNSTGGAPKPRRPPRQSTAHSTASSLDAARESSEARLRQVRAARAALLSSSDAESMTSPARTSPPADDDDAEAEAAEELLREMEYW